MSSRRERHLEALGLNREAGFEEIKGAYHRLAKEFHPDRHQEISPEAREVMGRRFLEIQAAYEALQSLVRPVRRRRRRRRGRLALLLIPIVLAATVLWLLVLLLGS